MVSYPGCRETTPFLTCPLLLLCQQLSRLMEIYRQHVLDLALKDVYDQTEFPELHEWYNRIISRPAVQRVLEKGAQVGGH